MDQLNNYHRLIFYGSVWNGHEEYPPNGHETTGKIIPQSLKVHFLDNVSYGIYQILVLNLFKTDHIFPIQIMAAWLRRGYVAMIMGLSNATLW